MRTTTYIFAISLIALLALSFIGCGGHSSEAWKSMDVAESIIEERPDTAFDILKSIDTHSLKGDEERARYALLMSMALDKNYIDTTTFDVLQPSIDYYLKKGTPNEKLKTYYYQGIIYLNQGDDDNAMSSFFKAKDFMTDVRDTLAITRLLTAQGILYAKQYKYKEYIDNSLVCAKLLHSKRMPMFELINLAKAFNGSVILNNKNLADSIKACINPIISEVNNGKDYMLPLYLLYTITFGSKAEIESALNQFGNEVHSNELNLDIAYGYALIGDGKKALDFYQMVDTTDSKISALKYLTIKSEVLASNGNYKDALQEHKNYCNHLENFHRELFAQDLLFAEKKHALESDKQTEERKKDQAVWIAIIVLILSTVIIGWQKHRHQLLSVRARFSEQERRLSEQEREKANLENENLRLRISQLESEREELKALPESNELPQPVADAIKERIEMLNALLAEKITDNDSYSKSYSKWIDTVTSDREKFMNSTRLAFKASHPKFIEYLESHDLTESEINYLCLYAIGLRGKEVGEYIQLKRHYHISSEIRSKLGIDEHETNIGIYVRKLLRQL